MTYIDLARAALITTKHTRPRPQCRLSNERRNVRTKLQIHTNIALFIVFKHISSNFCQWAVDDHGLPLASLAHAPVGKRPGAVPRLEPRQALGPGAARAAEQARQGAPQGQHDAQQSYVDGPGTRSDTLGSARQAHAGLVISSQIFCSFRFGYSAIAAELYTHPARFLPANGGLSQ